jgi:hypothetical protein
MKFAPAKEHRAFYAQHGWVEFEGLIESEEVEKINHEIDQILYRRMEMTEKFIAKAPAQEVFMHGHDLWRESLPLQRLCCRRSHAQISVDLFGTPLIRLGSDQLFPGAWKSSSEAPLSLLALSSFQDVIGGIVFCLRGGYHHDRGQIPRPITPYPCAPGNAIFFPGHIPLELSTLLAAREDRYLMVVYTPQKTLYLRREEDPHNHALKRIGYGFGDHLDNERHPMILR